MATKVEAFKCDYCGRLLKTPHTATWHEAACNKNPARRHCSTCIHGILACTEYKADWTDPYSPGMEEKGPYCGYHDKPMTDKPYFIDCDVGGGIDTGLGWLPEKPIPFSCWHYQSKGKAEWTPEEQYDGGTKDE